MKYINLSDPELEEEADKEFNEAFNYDKFHMSMSVIKVVIVLIVAVSILLGYSLHGLWASEPLVFTTVENIDSSIPAKNKVRFYTDAQLDGLYNGLFATTYSGQDGCDRFYNELKEKFENNYTLPDGYDFDNSFFVVSGGNIDGYFVNENTYYATAYDGTSYFISTSQGSKAIYYSFSPSTLECNGSYLEFALTRPSGNTWLNTFNSYFITMGPKAEFYINTGSGLSDQNYNPNYGKSSGVAVGETSKNNLYFPNFRVDLVGNDLTSQRGGDYVSKLVFTPSLNNYQNNNVGDFTLNIEAHLSGNYTNNNNLTTDYLGGSYYSSVPLNVFTQSKYINNYQLQLASVYPVFSPIALFKQENVEPNNTSTLTFKRSVNINSGITGIFNETLNEALLTVNVYLTDKLNNSSNVSTYVFDLLSGKATVDNKILDNPFPYTPDVPIEYPSNDTSDVVPGGTGSGANQLVNVTVNNSDLTPLDHFNMTNNTDIKDMFDNSYGVIEEVKDNSFLQASKDAFSIFPIEFWQPFITVFSVIASLIIIRAVINILT